MPYICKCHICVTLLNMKRFLFILALFATAFVTTNAQEANQYNIFTRDGDIVWQKVYKTELTEQQVFDQIRTGGNVCDVIVADGKISGLLIERSVEYASLGYTRMDVPIFLNHPHGGNFKLEMREGRYRVTVDHLYYVDETTPANKRTEFTFYVKKNGEIRLLSNTAQKIIDNYLNRIFEVKTTEEEDW